MNEQVVINKFVNDASDSIEIGTPAKGGAIKVYLNADKIEEAKKKIDNMIELREYANSKLNGG